MMKTMRSASARPSSTTTTTTKTLSPKKPMAMRATMQTGLISTLSGKRVDSLPDLAHLSLRASTPDVNSLVVPQPRKALVSPKIILTTQGTSPFDDAFNELMEVTEPSAQREALSELMDIICASRLGGWNGGDYSDTDSGSESPQLQRSPRDDDMILISQSMDVPSLSNSPAIFRVQLQSDSTEPFEDDIRINEDHFGTPPSRAQNPLAFSCHFANFDEGAELDLFRPSPPIYDRADGMRRLNWD